jgi:hypothetical protein
MSPFDDAVPNKAAIQSLHLVLNPKACITSRTKLHPMKSKAFEMSELNKKVWVFSFYAKVELLFVHK